MYRHNPILFLPRRHKYRAGPHHYRLANAGSLETTTSLQAEDYPRRSLRTRIFRDYHPNHPDFHGEGLENIH